jgi:hypothetical protein
VNVQSSGDEVQLGEAGRADSVLVPLDRPPLNAGRFGKAVL